MSAWLFKSTKEALARRNYYLAQLRRQIKAPRNASIAAYWKDQLAAQLSLGTKRRAAQKAAIEATGKSFQLDESQVRKILKDTRYMMSKSSIVHRLRELNGLSGDLEAANRMARFEFHVAAGIKAGHPAAKAFTGAISATAHEFGKHPGTIRRNLAAFGILRPPKK